jgi:hypothetical protein
VFMHHDVRNCGLYPAQAQALRKLSATATTIRSNCMGTNTFGPAVKNNLEVRLSRWMGVFMLGVIALEAVADADWPAPGAMSAWSNLCY